MQQITRGEEKPLDLGEALIIAEKHGYMVHAKPIITQRWGSIYGKGVTLYLPGYIMTIEINRNGKETITVEPANYCFCNCDSGSSTIW